MKKKDNIPKEPDEILAEDKALGGEQKKSSQKPAVNKAREAKPSAKKAGSAAKAGAKATAKATASAVAEEQPAAKVEAAEAKKTVDTEAKNPESSKESVLSEAALPEVKEQGAIKKADVSSENTTNAMQKKKAGPLQALESLQSKEETVGMKILFAAGEALPFIASGGLGDVAGSLPKAIQDARHTCRVVMPLYGDIKAEMRDKMHFVTSFTVELAWRRQYCGVFEATVSGVRYYFIDNEYYFRRTGIYGFFDDGERFAFFSKAVLDMISHIDYKPDIIHCNDWQTALIPTYLNCYFRSDENYRNIKTVFTIHNIQYQGQYSADIISDVLGLPKGYVEYQDCCNFMRGAIEQSDKITTVSPTYAQEILNEWYAHGLDRLLREQSHKLIGILNGIDTVAYNPEKDSLIYKNYTVKNFQNKSVNKQNLQKDLSLSQSGDPLLVGIVTRLVSHKGVDLIKFIFKQIIDAGMEIAVLGSGDYIYENFFEEMASIYPDKVAVRLRFDPELAHKIYAGADVLLMPSQSEPCGLAQMISLRYGTIPVVRKTGGLADSILDMGEKDGNGFTFQSYNAHDMLGALKRAQGLYYNKPDWERAVCNAMECDFSWSRSAKVYVEMYEQLMAK